MCGRKSHFPLAALSSIPAGMALPHPAPSRCQCTVLCMICRALLGVYAGGHRNPSSLPVSGEIKSCPCTARGKLALHPAGSAFLSPLGFGPGRCVPAALGGGDGLKRSPRSGSRGSAPSSLLLCPSGPRAGQGAPVPAHQGWEVWAQGRSPQQSAAITGTRELCVCFCNPPFF